MTGISNVWKSGANMFTIKSWKWDFSFSKRRTLRCLSSGTLCLVFWYILTDVSELLASSIIRAIDLNGTRSAGTVFHRVLRLFPVSIIPPLYIYYHEGDDRYRPNFTETVSPHCSSDEVVKYVELFCIELWSWSHIECPVAWPDACVAGSCLRS
jgi:hypothetical protein